MGLNMTQEELSEMTVLEQNCSKNVSVVNDIFSWEKELRAFETGDQEGSSLCTSVKILADETSLSIESSKHVLWAMMREWEELHDELVAQIIERGASQVVQNYMKGLEYQMSGNEFWS